MRTTVLEGRGLGTLPVLPREGRRVVCSSGAAGGRRPCAGKHLPRGDRTFTAGEDVFPLTLCYFELKEALV